MNRFRKEEIAASSAELRVPATPFSWSVSRHLLFRRCRRAYFLHYYYAQGGWDPYADELIRYTWGAKKNRTYCEWLDLQLEEILRFSFDMLRHTPFAMRSRILEQRFQSRLLVLYEGWKKKEAAGQFRFSSETAFRDLKSALLEFLRSDSCRVLITVQNLTLFHRAFTPSFYHQETELWYNPGLIWREGNLLVSLRIHNSVPDPEFIRAESDMFALSAECRTGTQNTVSIFRFRDPSGWQEIQETGDPAAGEERICNDKAEMLSLLRDESACMTEFPKNEKHCSDCRFSGVCAAMTEQFGEI